jgi:hypothetical protein
LSCIYFTSLKNFKIRELQLYLELFDHPPLDPLPSGEGKKGRDSIQYVMPDLIPAKNVIVDWQPKKLLKNSTGSRIKPGMTN